MKCNSVPNQSLDFSPLLYVILFRSFERAPHHPHCCATLGTQRFRQRLTVRTRNVAFECLTAFKASVLHQVLHVFVTDLQNGSHTTTAFSCGARSAFKLRGKRILEKHAIAPSAARLCWIAASTNSRAVVVQTIHIFHTM